MAVALSFLAGFIDALGFMHLGGYFVAFMSGNSTRMAVTLPDGLAGAVLPASLIALFVLGVVTGALMERRFTSPSVGLLVLAALLGLAAAMAYTGLGDIAILVAPVVMGAMNVLARGGSGAMAVTYMTGNLVKLGVAIAQTIGGGPKWGWLPFLLLWLGLITGVFSGAVTYEEIGLAALWPPAFGLAALAALGRVWR
jgi:uncharacterized membrane protein YoaK (UPF0700 family)